MRTDEEIEPAAAPCPRSFGAGHACAERSGGRVYSTSSTKRLAFAISVCALLGAGAAPTNAQRADPGEVHGLKLGLNAKGMTLEGFGDLACGSNGGPPRQRLDGWAEFTKCRPEASGLREVNARFDDEDEYISRAVEDPRVARGKIGTRIAGHPVILSVLFDSDGVVRGLRFITDPRATIYERRMAHILRRAVMERYGLDGWTCTDPPAAEGETPVGGFFLKQRCDKHEPGRTLMLEARMLRKSGQGDLDPATAEYRAGQFESWTRFEISDPSYKKQ